MNRKELLEYFNQYDEETILIVLSELGYSPEETTYPEEIIEDIERAFNSVNAAQKQLSGNGALVTAEQITAIASSTLNETNSSISDEILFFLANEALSKSIRSANVVADLATKAFVETYERRMESFGNQLLSAVERSTQKTNKLLSEDNLSRLFDAMVPKREPVNLEKFQIELQERIRANAQHKPIAIASNESKIDVDAFINKYCK
jgi:hypothetical protein